jgi:hypothetical protein
MMIPAATMNTRVRHANSKTLFQSILGKFIALNRILFLLTPQRLRDLAMSQAHHCFAHGGNHRLLLRLLNHNTFEK